MTLVTAIVPATDGPATLQRCLAAIEAASEPPEELIVVDEPAKLGPAAARNMAARQARGDILVFVDADVEVHPDVFVFIRNAFNSDESVAAVFGCYDDDPGGGGLVSDFRNLLHHYVHRESAGAATTFWAGLGAVRRDKFLAIGGFDEHRFPNPSIEDIDFGMRLAARGERIELDPRFQGKHLKHWTLLEMVRTDLYRRGIPWVRLLLAHGSPSTALNLGWRHRGSAVASLGLVGALAAGRPRLAFPPLVTLVVLNRSFYALVLEKRGLVATVAAVPLHIIHHLTSAAAVPLGIGVHLLAKNTREDPLA